MTMHTITDGRKRRSFASRKAILKAAREIFLEKGYSNNTMMEISVRAAVGYGTLYTHFSGKDDILNHLINEISEDFRRLVNLPYNPESVRDVELRISQEIAYLLKLAQKHRPILRVTYQAMGLSQSVRNYWEKIFQQHIDKAVHDYSYSFSKGLTKTGLDPAIVAKSCVFMIKEFFWAVVLEKEDDIENIGKNVASLFLHGAYR